MLPLTPTKLGRYEIVDEIGKGAMGVVYLARDPLIGRLVALKTFRIGYSVKDVELEQFRARFIREAQSAGILSHPNIVTIHDVVESSDEGLAFIAMEYVRGTNLKSVLQEDRRPPLTYVIGVIAQVAEALDYAHSCKVIHRDVKPANILITADDRVKIADFGIARLDSSNLTQEGQLLGTPNYMAPEQILGRDIDARADIFSLGVVLYEMLTRHKPFQGENLTVVSHRIVYDHFTPLGEYVDDLPPGTEAILNKALEKDPGRRYQRARDLADDLRRVLGEVSPHDPLNETQSLSSTAVLPADRLAGLISSAPTLVTAGSAGAGVGGGTAGWTSDGPAGTPAAAAGAPGVSAGPGVGADGDAAGSGVPARAPRPPFFKRLIRGTGKAGARGAAPTPAGAGAAVPASPGTPGTPPPVAYPHATRPTPKPVLAAVPPPAPGGSPGAASAPPASADLGPAVPEGAASTAAGSAPAQAAGAASPAPGSALPAPRFAPASASASAFGLSPEPDFAALSASGSALAAIAAAARAWRAPATGGQPLPASPALAGGRPGPFSTSATRALLLSAAALILAVAAGWGLFAWARQQSPRGRVSVDTAADANRHTVLRLMQEGKRLLESGDPRGAAAAYREAQQLAPEQAASLKKRREDAERQALERDRRMEVERNINSNLASARAYLTGRRYAEADAAASAVLAVSPGNTAAEEVKTAAQAALRRKEKVSGPALAAKQAAAQRAQDAAVATPPTAASRLAGAPVPAAAEAASDATLELAFFSELPEGTVMVYVNDTRVLHKSYDFHEKGGLSGFFRTRSHSDWVHGTMQVPAGSVRIRLYVTPQGRAAQVRELPGNFSGGTTHRLDAKLASSGLLDCSLN